MNNRMLNVLRRLRKDLIIGGIMLIAITLCLVISLYRISQNEYDKSELINVLGKQRMYTQVMAKDVNLKLSGTVHNEYTKIQQELINAKQQFNETNNQIMAGSIKTDNDVINLGQSGKLLAEDEKKVNSLWQQFQQAVDTVINTDKKDTGFISAVNFVNDNNEKLLKDCDDITGIIVNSKKDISHQYTTISIISALLFFITIAALTFRSYKYLIIPLNTFIEGMADAGVFKGGVKLYQPTKQEVEPAIIEVSNMSQKLENMISLMESINQNLTISEELEFIFHKFSTFIPYSYIGIALVKDEGKALEASYGVGDSSIHGLPQKFKGKRFALQGSTLEDILLTGNTRIINDLELYTKDRTKKEYNRIIMEAGIKASITVPLIVERKPLGIIFFSSTKKNVYKDEHVKFLSVIAQSLAISFDKNIFVDNLLYSSILALAKLAEARDEDTGEHIDRMKIYSRHIAQMLYEDSLYKDKITFDFIDDIERFSPMHDIGKVGVRDSILLKPAKLTEDEFDEMKKHTLFGAEVLKAAEENILKTGRSIFKIGIEIAEGHHEKWDGSGYPYGKCGQDIPLSARIVAVADVFDALTSKRPYKKAFSFDESLGFIIEGSGRHFDPEIVRVFTKNIDRIERLYKSFNR